MFTEEAPLRGQFNNLEDMERLGAAIKGNQAYLVGFNPVLSPNEFCFDGLKLLLGIMAYASWAAHDKGEAQAFQSN